jgi:hypothetical protein
MKLLCDVVVFDACDAVKMRRCMESQELKEFDPRDSGNSILRFMLILSLGKKAPSSLLNLMSLHKLLGWKTVS